MTPQFIHDCTKCQFLGSAVVEGVAYDMYYCAGEPTILARWSSEGPDYSSGICFGASAMARALKGEKVASKPLMVAYTMAMANGLELAGGRFNEPSVLNLINGERPDLVITFD